MGYAMCNTMNTQRARFLTPTEWANMLKGPGFWFTPSELKKILSFILKVCDQSKMCTDDAIKEITAKFEDFIKAVEAEKTKKGLTNEKPSTGH